MSPPRSVVQMRPRNSSPDAMPYCPDRDLASLYVPAMREALWGLDQVNWRPFFKDWMDACGLTEETLGEGVRRFVEAHRFFTGHPEIKEPVEALARAGFTDMPPAVQAAIYFRIGEVITAGFFIALRDVTTKGDCPPNVSDIALTIASGRLMAERLTGQRKRPHESLEQLETQLEAARIEIEEHRMSRSRIWDQVHQAEANNRRLADELFASQCAHRSEVDHLRKRRLWQTLRDWWTWRRDRRRRLKS